MPTPTDRSQHPPKRERTGVEPIDSFALLIGAMKAGTTTLYAYLAQHPELASNQKSKEPHFFSSDKNWARGLPYYYRQYEFDPQQHRYAFEASTHYSKYPFYKNVPERIASTGATFKYIYILRQPVDRIESHLAHNVSRGWLNFDEHQRLIGHAVNVSSYARQIDRYVRTFPDFEVLLLDLADLTADPIGVAERCADYLGLDPGFKFEPIEPLARRKSVNGSERVILTPEQRDELSDRLRDDVRRMRDHYQFDTSRWGID